MLLEPKGPPVLNYIQDGYKNWVSHRRQSSWTPNALFASGESGDWFDPSDLSRMWQDTAGTTPITADGQSVARIDGQRGVVSLRQSDAARRPLYKTSAGLHWLQFDGTNDNLASAETLNFSAVDVHTLAIGATKNTAASSGDIGVFGIPSLNGSFAINSPNEDAYQAISRGTTLRFQNTATIFVPPSTNVLVQLAKISAPSLVLRVDGIVRINDTSSQGSGNYGNYLVRVASRSGSDFFFNGNLYFLLMRGALTSGASLDNLEAFAAAKTGVTL
jgi:hypothetical protein